MFKLSSIDHNLKDNNRLLEQLYLEVKTLRKLHKTLEEALVVGRQLLSEQQLTRAWISTQSLENNQTPSPDDCDMDGRDEEMDGLIQANLPRYRLGYLETSSTYHIMVTRGEKYRPLCGTGHVQRWTLRRDTGKRQLCGICRRLAFRRPNPTLTRFWKETVIDDTRTGD